MVLFVPFQVPIQHWALYSISFCLSAEPLFVAFQVPPFRDTTWISMQLNYTIKLNDCLYLGTCLEGFLFGAISVLQLPRPLLKKSNIYSPLPSFPGLYSGIFALHIHCHASRTDTANNIFFYFLCFLYALSIATICVAMLYYLVISVNGTLVLPAEVSKGVAPFSNKKSF